uniref:Tissue factor n=1 Tax=Mola mola TaxID=94237 RepID=A0A3Q3W6M1_MOLML
MIEKNVFFQCLETFVFELTCFIFAGSYPRAYNITWKSNNFKTLLTWGPEPSNDYSYTVELSAVGGNKQRIHNCVRSSSTHCDVTHYLTDLTSSDIGKPDFKLEVSEDKKKTTLHVTDLLTNVFKDGHQQNIRDIFGDKLKYRVNYGKNKSTGKKKADFKTSKIELTDLDPGESYCFTVQAFIQSRSFDKQLGELSKPQCSDDNNKSIFTEFSPGVIAVAVLLILLLIGVIVAVAVVCHKLRQKVLKGGRGVLDA